MPKFPQMEVRGYTVDSDPDSREQISFNECNRDPIFLLQKRVFMALNPDYLVLGQNCDHDGEDLWVSTDMFSADQIAAAKEGDGEFRERDEADEDVDYDAINVTDYEAMEYGWAIFDWRTESIWARRDEAEAFARSQKHNLGTLGKSCRVYCICAEGRLAKILNVIDRKGAEDFIQSQQFRDAYDKWVEENAKQKVGV